MACSCTEYPVSGNEVANIPVKIGEPLSTACQRAVTIGSIPQIINFANFTLVDGAIPTSKPSNGGIANMGSFFTSRKGCFYNEWSQDYGTTCA